MAPLFGYAWGLLVDTPTLNAEAGAVGSLPYKHQFAALRACEPNVQFQNPKFKIQLFNGLRPSEKRAKARGEEPCYARW